MRIFKNCLESFFKNDRIHVMINGKRYMVLGKVGMNHIAVDITDGDVKLNDEVSLDVSPILVSSKIRREYI